MSMAKSKTKTYTKYDRGHRFDRGATEAYARGERPHSHWTKKIIVEELSLVIDNSDYTLAKIYNKYKTNKTEVKQELSKLPRPLLMKNVLKRTGTHKTGNYYQNTSFYRVLRNSELPDFIERFIVKPKEVIQLKLNIPVL